MITVWSADRSATVAAYMWDDAANPWVSRTAGPDPAISWWTCTASIVADVPVLWRVRSAKPALRVVRTVSAEMAATTRATWSARSAGSIRTSGWSGSS